MHNDILLHCVTTRINQDALGLFVVITILMLVVVVIIKCKKNCYV
jgi:hypothetical protein